MADKAKPDPKQSQLAQLNATIDSAPPPDPTTQQTPVSVPKGYPNVKYFTGDLYAPGAWNPDAIKELQTRMDAAGLYTPNAVITPGYWNPKVDVPAYEQVLGNANASNRDWTLSLGDLLSASAANGGGAGARGKSTRAPLVTSTASPTEVRYMAQQVAQKHIGRNLTDAELSKFSAAYDSVQTRDQTMKYDESGKGGGGGSYTTPPSIEAAASQFAEGADPMAAYATKYVGAFDTVAQMLGASPGGAKPSGSGIGTTGV